MVNIKLAQYVTLEIACFTFSKNRVGNRVSIEVEMRKKNLH